MKRNNNNNIKYTTLAEEEEKKIGLLQWFHLGDYQGVEQTLSDMKRLGIHHLRTGISWADYYTRQGPEWYQWLLPKLSKEVEILPCFLYTPPSIGIAHKTSSPPKGPKKFADFMDVFLKEYGKYLEWVELWNEPNNRSEYDYTLDSNWDIFCEMIICASYWCRHLGKKVALGGMSPIDVNWLDFMAQRNVLQNIDAVGIHGFPDSFDPHFSPWNDQIEAVRKVLDDHDLDPEIWITEAGFSTWQHDEKKQVREFIKAINADADRVYWYSLFDLSPTLPSVDGFHLDEREYYFGLKNYKNKPKLLYRMLELYGSEGIKEISWWEEHNGHHRKQTTKDHEYILITGGAGFIGTNLANHFLSQGHKVIVFDNLSRPGVEKNLEWLNSKYDNKILWVELADVRNFYQLKKAVDHAKMIFHLAAQVAVTTSLEDPAHDFDVNIKGTFNLLEAIRLSEHKPPVIFTSTNKVYGTLAHLKFDSSNYRYYPVDESIKKYGVNENQPLDFHSPYGNSKGAAEQYVLDYARSFNLKAAVFRMSCIYGPHQFGNEDQGWIAHFIINTIKDKTIQIYGDGRQVRDVLYIDDLIRAFQLAWDNIDTINAQAFNIGGGSNQSISLLELINLIEHKKEQKINVRFDKFRTGDQVYYVSDSRKFKRAAGWSPSITVDEGVDRLYNWLVNEFKPHISLQQLTNGLIHE